MVGLGRHETGQFGAKSNNHGCLNTLLFFYLFIHLLSHPTTPSCVSHVPGTARDLRHNGRPAMVPILAELMSTQKAAVIQTRRLKVGYL